MGRVNIHLYPSPFTHETRMLKITKSLADRGVFDEIHLVALWKEGLPERERLDDVRRVWRVRLSEGRFARGKLAKWLEWMLRGVWGFRGRRVACVNPHSVACLPMGAWLKRLKKCKLVYDTHELETETATLGGARKRLTKKLERKYLGRCDAVSVVSEGIAEWYQREYSLPHVWTVKNFPYRRAAGTPAGDELKRHCGLREGETLFLYQGLLSLGRGLELMLRVFANAKPDKHLVLMGYGDYEAVAREYAGKHPNIHFHPAVKPEEVARFTASADVGLSLIENVCLSYYHSLPNKLFEYLNAGLPVIVSDFPDMGALVEAHQCGWRVEVSEQALAAAIHGINAGELSRKRENALEWARSHTWQTEEDTLVRMYGELFPGIATSRGAVP
jgi:glycosyltransferase involved in cell wall biosynthesis